MIKKFKEELLIRKYQLRKENGCFDINKALLLEKILLKNKELNSRELEVLKGLLG